MDPTPASRLRPRQGCFTACGGLDTRDGNANPIYLLAAITLGIPALLLIPLIGMNPGIQEGAFSFIVVFFAVAAFVVAAVFEIKRLADQPTDSDHH